MYQRRTKDGRAPELTEPQSDSRKRRSSQTGPPTQRFKCATSAKSNRSFGVGKAGPASRSRSTALEKERSRAAKEKGKGGKGKGRGGESKGGKGNNNGGKGKGKGVNKDGRGGKGI